MAELEMTTARILREDQQLIEGRFGKPFHRGLHKLVAMSCEHPDDKRCYVTITVNANRPGQALNRLDGEREQIAYQCTVCGAIIPAEGPKE